MMPTKHNSWWRPMLALGLSSVGVFALAADSALLLQQLERPAHFQVRDTVVNPSVGPFSATVAGFGNTLNWIGGSFEPVWFHNAVIATQDAADRVVASDIQLTDWGVFREHMLEGARVEVYRVVNGEMRMVREDQVRPGGSHATGWSQVNQGSLLIPAGQQHYRYRWDNIWRPAATSFFMLRSVDRNANESVPSNVVSADSPAEPVKSPALVTTQEGPARAEPKPLQTESGPPPPLHLRGHVGADGILDLEWDGAPGGTVAGYRLYQSDTPSDQQRGYYLELANHAASAEQQIRKGDWVFLARKVSTLSRQQDLNYRLWNSGGEGVEFRPPLLDFYPDENPGKTWQLVPHEAGSPVEDGGETYLKLTLAAGEHAEINMTNHSGIDTDYYPVLQTRAYQMAVWMRREGAGSVRFGFHGDFDEGARRIPPVEFSPGPRWKLFSSQFRPSEILRGTRASSMALQFTGPGVFCIDNFRITRADTPFLNWLPEDLKALRESGLSSLRTHAFIKTRFRGYDLQQLTNPGGSSPGTLELNTLPQTLAGMKAADVQPWLQVEPYLTPSEWLGLVEYLAAPFDPVRDTASTKPWAYKRFHQGHPAPWTDDFREFHLEIGNETWNPTFQPWTFHDMRDAVTGKSYSSGAVYGLFQEHVIRLLKSSPYWAQQGLERKFKFVIGGWTVNLGYGNDAAQASLSSDLLTIAGYNSAWHNGDGMPPEDNVSSYFEVLTDVSRQSIPYAQGAAAALPALNAGRQHKLTLGTYEAGPDYVMSNGKGQGISREQSAAQERVMKSLAAGTATLDAFLARAQFGFTEQNYFLFQRTDRWSTHARWYQGGQPQPAWSLISLFNREGTGTMLRTDLLSAPTWEVPLRYDMKNLREAPLVGAYALRRGQRFMLFVVSRKVPGYPIKTSAGFTPVTVDLPFGHYKSLQLFRMTGAYNDNNLESAKVKVENLAFGPVLKDRALHVDESTGGDARGLPPAATFLYVFEGTDLPLQTISKN